jgi:hypothetical protein
MQADMTTQAAITQRENALFTAMVAMDFPALDGLLAADLSYVHSTGVVETKAEYLAALPRGLYEYGTITRLNGFSQIFDGVAVTRGMIDMVVGAGGSGKGLIRLQHTLVWVAQEGQWRLSLRQATRIPI